MSPAKQRRRLYLVGALIAAALLLFAVFGTWAATRQHSESNRADTATAALASACAEVDRLGGHCAIDPASLKGDQGDAGPSGPPGRDGTDGVSIVGPSGPSGSTGPTGSAGAQGPVGPQGGEGPPGPAGADGQPGPTCPTGYHTEVVRIRTTTGARDILACVPDPAPTPTPTPQQ